MIRARSTCAASVCAEAGVWTRRGETMPGGVKSDGFAAEMRLDLTSPGTAQAFFGPTFFRGTRILLSCGISVVFLIAADR
jgi:hypothetical protein